jgi:hypothetical protein
MRTWISSRHVRSDLTAIACLGVVATCLAFKSLPYAMVALGFAVFCATIPRMKGEFGLRIGKVFLGGTLTDPDEVILKVKVSEVGEGHQAEDRGPPSNREPPAD